MIYGKINPYVGFPSFDADGNVVGIQGLFLLDTFSSTAAQAIADHTGELGATWTQNDATVPYTVDAGVLSQETTPVVSTAYVLEIAAPAASAFYFNIGTAVSSDGTACDMLYYDDGVDQYFVVDRVATDGTVSAKHGYQYTATDYEFTFALQVGGCNNFFYNGNNICVPVLIQVTASAQSAVLQYYDTDGVLATPVYRVDTTTAGSVLRSEPAGHCVGADGTAYQSKMLRTTTASGYYVYAVDTSGSVLWQKYLDLRDGGTYDTRSPATGAFLNGSSARFLTYSLPAANTTVHVELLQVATSTGAKEASYLFSLTPVFGVSGSAFVWACQDEDGAVYVTARTGTSLSASTLTVVKINSALSAIDWSTEINATNSPTYEYIAACGGAVAAGVLVIPLTDNLASANVGLVGLSTTDGSVLWERTFTGGTYHTVSDIAARGTEFRLAVNVGDTTMASVVLPVDGTGTGAYGAYTYAAGTVVASTSAVTFATGRAAGTYASTTDVSTSIVTMPADTVPSYTSTVVPA